MFLDVDGVALVCFYNQVVQLGIVAGGVFAGQVPDFFEVQFLEYLV